MARINRTTRAAKATQADRHAADVAARLGAALRDARRSAGLFQAEAGRRAGLSQATWSALENRRDARYTLATWDRAAFAVGGSLSAYIQGASAADRPRDAVHLKHQELVIRTALAGGWAALPEEAIDREARTSRFADVLLHRRLLGPRRASPPPPPPTPAEYALIEVIDWFDDVGAPTRAWHRRLEAVERYAIARMRGEEPVPRIGGCWIVRATRRNRDLIAEHRHFFRARFPGSGRAWLAALTSPTAPLPADSALLWVSVSGERLYPARLG